MAISDNEFQAWLRARDLPRMYLVEAGYGELTGGGILVEGTEYASRDGYISHAADTPPNTLYADVLAAIPTIRFDMDSLTIGEIEIINDAGERDHWLARYWDGRSLRLLIGAPDWPKADFRPLLVGTLAGIAATSPATLIWKVRDNRVLLDVSCQPNLYTTGNLKDRPKPISLGFCFNIEPIFVPPDATTDMAVTLTYDQAIGLAAAQTASANPFDAGDVIEIWGASVSDYNGVYAVDSVDSVTRKVFFSLATPFDLADGTGTMGNGSLTYHIHDGPVAEIVQVRDNGFPVDFIADESTGQFTLQAQPFGALRADVRGGLLDGDEVTMASDMVRWLCAHAGIDAALLDDANLDAWATECPQSLGYHLADAKNVGDAIADIAATLDAHTSFSRLGQLRFWRLESSLGAATDTIESEDIVPDSFFPTSLTIPPHKVTLGYQRNWSPVDASTLADVTPAKSTLYSTEYRQVKATRSVTLARHPLAPDVGVVNTLFSALDSTDSHAIAEAERRLDVVAVHATPYQLDVMSAPGRFSVGQVVEIIYDRWGFDSGKAVVITSVDDRADDGRVGLEVL